MADIVSNLFPEIVPNVDIMQTPRYYSGEYAPLHRITLPGLFSSQLQEGLRTVFPLQRIADIAAHSIYYGMQPKNAEEAAALFNAERLRNQNVEAAKDSIINQIRKSLGMKVQEPPVVLEDYPFEDINKMDGLGSSIR